MFQDAVRNLSRKKVSWMGKGIPRLVITRFHDPQQVLWCNRTQLKLESHWFLRQQISTLCQEKYNIHTKIIYISSFKNRLSSPFCPTGFYFKSKIVESSRCTVFLLIHWRKQVYSIWMTCWCCIYLTNI